MVRLEGYLIAGQEATEPHFNSTMVRLEEGNKQVRTFKYKFQFHDGTIRRKVHALPDHFANPFQFHDGTIRRLLNKTPVPSPMTISIPRWYD